MVAKPRDLLLDVSRLIWRRWGARLPTGIDRVCLEYVAHFGARAQAVVQFRGCIFVLTPDCSDRLFDLVLRGGRLRARLLALAARALPGARRSAPAPGAMYLNVGHTGLHNAALPAWIAANGLLAVYVIHDLIPITHPQFCRPGEAEKHRMRIENALASASGIVGNSRATLEELNRFAAKRGLPMPPAIAAWISGYAPPANVAPKKLDRPYFVSVGTIEGRKNHILLLEIWRRLIAAAGGENAPVLVIIGQRGWEAESTTAILDTGELNGHVLEIGRCGDEELASWMKGARALLMPSFAEGFGLPVIEALQVGTPVIASDLAVYREVAGDIPTYVNPVNADGWEAAVRSFVGDSPARERQRLAVAGYVAPEWRSHFAAVENWLDHVREPVHVGSSAQQFSSSFQAGNGSVVNDTPRGYESRFLAAKSYRKVH
jgi:glycosyltransferase involved in cell wall biosynthesis